MNITFIIKGMIVSTLLHFAKESLPTDPQVPKISIQPLIAAIFAYTNKKIINFNYKTGELSGLINEVHKFTLLTLKLTLNIHQTKLCCVNFMQ